MKKIIISLGIIYSGLFFVSAQTAPAAPSKVTLSAPVSTATSSVTPIKYTIKWTDNAINESGYQIALFDYPSGGSIATTFTSSNATSATILTAPSMSPRYAVVTAANDFGSNGTSSALLAGATYPLSPSNIILSATSSRGNIKYSVRWNDNAINESGYQIGLFDYPSGTYITTAFAPANTKFKTMLASPSTSARYVVVTASNDFGSNGTSSNIVSGSGF